MCVCVCVPECECVYLYLSIYLYIYPEKNRIVNGRAVIDTGSIDGSLAKP